MEPFVCRCGVQLVEKADPTPLQAELGVWFVHPPIEGRPTSDMVGHFVSAVVPHDVAREAV